MHYNFEGKLDLPQNILELVAPYQCFSYFFTDSFIDLITRESNLFSTQKNPNKPANLTAINIRRFLGVCTYMSVSSLPRTRAYWRNDIGVSNSRDAMTINEFEKIKNTLHFNDNHTIAEKGDPKYDKLHKIRPLIDHLNNRFSSIPLEPQLAIDEQICATKCRNHMKQYLPMKPHKWGFKFYMLCGVTGFSYNFEMYTGPENFFTKLKEDEPDLGVTGNVVVHLTRIVPKNLNHCIYFDNFYTSVPLMVYLANHGIYRVKSKDIFTKVIFLHDLFLCVQSLGKRENPTFDFRLYSLGTVRQNRLPNNKLLGEKEMKQLDRGTCEEYVTNIDGVDLSAVAWKDNKTVSMLSTAYGELLLHKVTRYDRKQKKNISINCPNVIIQYNKHMGGKDLLDSHIGRYKIPLRSKKWYFENFFHLLDVSLINAWLLHNKIQVQNEKENMVEKNLWEFRLEVAECLCNMGPRNEKKRGRPSNGTQQLIVEKRKRGPAAHIPPTNIRNDETSHWIKYDSSRQSRAQKVATIMDCIEVFSTKLSVIRKVVLQGSYTAFTCMNSFSLVYIYTKAVANNTSPLKDKFDKPVLLS
ncbi:hypothetical protein NQ317_017188, partial [Molorchus minor]